MCCHCCHDTYSVRPTTLAPFDCQRLICFLFFKKKIFWLLHGKHIFHCQLWYIILLLPDLPPWLQVLIFPPKAAPLPPERDTKKHGSRPTKCNCRVLFGRFYFLIQFWLDHLIVGSRSLWSVPWRMARLLSCLWQVAASCLIPSKLLSLVTLLLNA